MPKPGYFSLRMTDERRAALATICARLRIDSTKRGSVGIAIDYALHRTIAERSPMNERNLTTLAESIYSAVFGSIDDKYFAETKTTEIRDWLEAGDLDDNPNVTELAAEWREYDSHDVAERLGIEDPNHEWSVDELVDLASNVYPHRHYKIANAKSDKMSLDDYVQFLVDEATTDQPKRGKLADPFDPEQIKTVRIVTSDGDLQFVENWFRARIEDDWNRSESD